MIELARQGFASKLSDASAAFHGELVGTFDDHKLCFPIPDIDLRMGGSVQPASDPVVKFLKYSDRIQQTQLRSDQEVDDLMDAFSGRPLSAL